MPIITLTTDFGQEDPYVGVMKGVILGIAPGVRLVDLTHGIPPQDVLAGALALEAALPYFPPGAIHLAVVDPGVGTERTAVAVQTATCLLVGPDNGLFTLALAREPALRAVALTRPAYRLQPVSATFHGRDIFAPAAAHLAAGVPLEELGDPLSQLAPLDLPISLPLGDEMEAHVLHVDHFGNLVTDLTAEELAAWSRGAPVRVRVGGARIDGLSRTYADVPEGAPVAYVGSGGRLEIGVRGGSAARKAGVRAGDAVRLERV